MRPRARLGDERKFNDWEFDELNGSSDKFLVEISPVCEGSERLWSGM